ncbi:HAD family hydrolase [Natronomonas sp. EA1]|uniref:HAD family hydrolase n=1 Tax=Natronomonas sp. EA1 TaxID=3421655 RepID=UPI003EBBC01C
MIVSFDLFGTLVDAPRPADPAAAVARELAARGIAVPADWPAAYATAHVEVEAGAELPLAEHVLAALASRGVDADFGRVGDAVRAAFAPDDVTVREGAPEAIAAASEHGPVAVCSNCSVPRLAERALSLADLPAVDTVVTSVGCGWRKPDRRAFEAVVAPFDASLSDLIHVGDDPRTDGGIADCGGEFVHVDEVSLPEFPDWLEGER